MTVTAAIEDCPLKAKQLVICAQALSRNKKGEFVNGVPGVQMTLYRNGAAIEGSPTGADGTASFSSVKKEEMDQYSVSADAAPLNKPWLISIDVAQAAKDRSLPQIVLRMQPSTRTYNVEFKLVQLVADPGALSFAPVPLGTAAKALEFTITNPGVFPLQIDKIEVKGGARGCFSTGPAPAPIDPGKSAKIQVDATPSKAFPQPTATIVVTTSEKVVIEIPVTAASYSAAMVKPDPFTPKKEELKFSYAVDDPEKVVVEAELQILDGTTVIHTIKGVPHAPKDNSVPWKGEVTDKSKHPSGFIDVDPARYKARLVLAQAGAKLPYKLSTPVVSASYGDLLIAVQRADDAALKGRAKVRVHGNGFDKTFDTAAKGNREEVMVPRLEPGNYKVELQNASTYLGAETQARLAPAQDGIAAMQVKPGERATLVFELSNYTKVQFVGLHAMPTGTTEDLTGGSWKVEYTGLATDMEDVFARCELVKKAMRDAVASTTDIPVAPDTLKVFMSPEFLFRGKNGGYPLELVEEILPALAEETSKVDYKDWLFVHGTAIGYFRHTDPDHPGQRVPHALSVKTYTPAIPVPATLAKVTVTEDATLRVHDRTDSATVAICARIEPNRAAPMDWLLKHAGGENVIVKSTKLSETEYELELEAGSPVVAEGPVKLLEPLGTEVFNVALIQRGGPGRAERDLLVMKETISSIDYQGQYTNFGTRKFDASPTFHRALLHGTSDELILFNEGSNAYNPNLTQMQSYVNTPSVGGVSEVNRTGSGGGSIFTIAGVSFGLEVCLDHGVGRLWKYAPKATPGDPVPQMVLIPSWGMTIADGNTYVEAGGPLFNVDGRDGYAPEAGTFVKVACTDAAHSAAIPNYDLWCNLDHYVCTNTSPHIHFQQGTGACISCGAATAKMYECKSHYVLAPNCDRCSATGLPHVINHCVRHGPKNAPDHDVCPDSKKVHKIYKCTASHVNFKKKCACNTAGTEINLRYCNKHGQIEHNSGNCVWCGKPLKENYNTQLATRFTKSAVKKEIDIADPPAKTLADETVTTTVTIKDKKTNKELKSETKVTPAGRAPLALPDSAFVEDTSVPGTVKRTWTIGTITVVSEKKTTTTDKGDTLEVKEVTTSKRSGTVTAVQSKLLHATKNSKVYIFGPLVLPEAKVR